MHHGGGRCRAMPMFLTWGGPDYVSRLNLLDWFTPTLNQAGTSRYDQRLTQRMTVPGCSRARLECHVRDGHARWGWRLVQGFNSHIARKPFCGAFGGRL